MRLLISAYACAPNRGSEHAVGWNWTTEAHRLGHQVSVLASPAHRDPIAAACRADPGLRDIRWVFPEVHAWPLQPEIEPRWERTYNLLWQLSALRHARALHRETPFDAVHHLTWGGVRAPTFLGSLRIPLIIGPIGGGETSPQALRDQFGFKARLTEKIRDLSNATITINPVVRQGLASAQLIICRTADTRGLLTAAMQEKSDLFSELSLNVSNIKEPRNQRTGPPRLIYAGRLLYWKGVHIAIEALAELLRRMPDARLTIVGTGPEEPRLRRDAANLGVDASIDFVRWLPRERLFDLYNQQDVLLLPSLHDSGGTVVLEALSQGLPVICLNLGGPKDMVTPTSGIVVDVTGRNSAQVAAAMAHEMVRLFEEPARLSALSEGAIARARDYILTERVTQLYARIEAVVSPSPRRRQSSAGHSARQPSTAEASTS